MCIVITELHILWKQTKKRHWHNRSNCSKLTKSKKKTITKSIKEEINDTWTSHIKTLLCQGHFFRLEEFELSDTARKSYMFNLPWNTVTFLLNSVFDTLPTNSNLMKWGKRSYSKYELCSHHETMLHTLNNCLTMLKDGRYTWKHNGVLSHMFTLAQNPSKETDWIIHSDLPGHNNKCGISQTFVLQPRYQTLLW